MNTMLLKIEAVLEALFGPLNTGAHPLEDEVRISFREMQDFNADTALEDLQYQLRD